MQKLRVHYAKRGRARFASHRDFSRAFERALRRAGVPMAFSSGFHPHPRVSFANAAPTGAATEAEYLEIGLAETRDPAAVREALNAALPEGFDIVAVVEATPGALADQLTASQWRIDVVGIAPEVMDAAVAALLATDTLEVERMTKTGMRAFDARGAIIALSAGDGSLDLISRHGTPLVRPDDVLQALTAVEPRFTPAQPPVLTRLAQGEWDGTRIVPPFQG